MSFKLVKNGTNKVLYQLVLALIFNSLKSTIFYSSPLFQLHNDQCCVKCQSLSLLATAHHTLNHSITQRISNFLKHKREYATVQSELSRGIIFLIKAKALVPCYQSAGIISFLTPPNYIQQDYFSFVVVLVLLLKHWKSHYSNRLFKTRKRH